MITNKKTEEDISDNFLQNGAGGFDSWKAAEERNIRESLRLSYTERFRIMLRLMRMDIMLSRAKITHKKAT